MPVVPNRISATLSDDEVSRVLTLMDDMEKSMPFLLALEQNERKVMPKFGDSRIGFINQGYELIKQDNSFIPSSFSVEEMGKDVILLNQMRTILTRFGRLSQKMRDTYLTVGSEAYKASLIVYDNGKTNATPEVMPIIQSMGELFQNAKKEPDTTDSSSASSGG